MSYDPSASQAAWERDRAEDLHRADRYLENKPLDVIIGQLAKVVPPRYQNAIATDPDALEWLDEILFGNPVGLMLLGATGRGKTHLAYGLIRQLIAAQCNPLLPRCTIIAGSVPTLLANARPGQRIKTRHAWDGSIYEVDIVEEYKNCGMLFLDDLGAEKASEWTSETLYQIVDHRYNHMLPVIVASNLPPADLAKAIGDRLASRLTEMCRTVVIKGDDRRRLRVA